MAFNPFTSFRKYQKFWMASVLLVCMVTFVLCTGVGGDLSDRIIGWFGGSRGSKLASLDGRDIYSRELHDLKEQRQLADRFMRKSFEILDRQITEFINATKKKDQPNDDERRFFFEGMMIKRDLPEILQKKNYWDSGTKLEELVDFLMWKNVADRLNIELTDQSVHDLFNEEVFSSPPKFFFPRNAEEALYEVRGGQRHVTWGTIIHALRDEFRVRLAKLAAVEAQVHAYLGRREKIFVNLKLRHVQDYPWPIAPEVRSPISPHDLWEYHRKSRAEYDVALLPVRAQDFAALVAKPTPQELESFYKERRKLAYDPVSPEAGLKMPQKLKAEFVMGDPQTDFYQKPAKALTQLGMYAAALNRTAPLVTTAIELAAIVPAQNAKLDTLLVEEGKRFLIDELGDNRYLWTLYQKYGGKPTLEGALSLLAALPGPVTGPVVSAALYQTSSLRRFERENARDLDRERTNRLLVAGGLVQLGSVPTPLPPQVIFEAWKPSALAGIKKNLQKAGVDNRAIRWVQRNMDIVRGALERTKGNPETMKLRVPRLIDEYGLVRGATKDYYDRFNIDKAPELKPLLDAYRKYYQHINLSEGRSGTAQQLKEDQFSRLFFDSESFSVASREYYVRPWPPQVVVRPTFRAKPEDFELIQDPELLQQLAHQAELGGEAKVIDFFEKAEKPILFWKTDDVPATEPPDLPFAKLGPEMQKRTEDLWRLEKARETKTLPKAQQIAEALQKIAGENLARAVEAEANQVAVETKAEVKVIRLDGVAHLAPLIVAQDVRRYRDFRLPKDKFEGEYPRDDMVKEVLALIDAKGPIETGENGSKQLDELNKTLFEKSKGLNKQIQILMNKPRTAYYVAVVVNAPGASPADFQRAYKNALHGRDEFMYRAHQELAKAYLEEVTVQLRSQMNYDISATKDERKSFD